MPESQTSPAAAPAPVPVSDKRADTVLWVVLALALAVEAVLVAITPTEAMLGWMLKPVLFHGASTWVNLATFTLTGVLAVVYLVNRRPGTYAYVAAARYVSFALWILNTALGMFSAWITWGDAFWAEPRLQVSFWILIAVALAIAVDIMMDKPALHSAFDIAIAIGVWAFVLLTPKEIHPNSPVLASGMGIQLLFAGMVAAWGVAALVVIRLWEERLLVGGAGVPGMPDEVD